MDEQRKQQIRDFYYSNCRMPSFSELMQLAGYRSRHSAHRLVKRLTKDGFLSQDSTGRLLPGSGLYSSLKVLGLIEAGFPSAAEEDHLDTLSLDEFLISNRQASFLLQVKGDSMIEAGIKPGDLVIADRSATAKTGDIVIAEIDGEWTMKYLRGRPNHFYLEPANSAYRPLHPEHSLKIEAVVKAVVRKYR